VENLDYGIRDSLILGFKVINSGLDVIRSKYDTLALADCQRARD
jgi:hypothetical protein